MFDARCLLGSLTMIFSRAMLPAAMAAGLLGCGGTIELGADRGDTGLTIAVADVGVGPRPDGGAMGPSDVGACTPRTRPAIPATWPYPTTKQAYLTNFFNVLPGTASGCGLAGACHGTGGRPPFIPMTTTQLDVPTDLQQALAQLWLRARPPAGGGVPTLRSKHDPNAAVPVAPAFTPQQMAALDSFIALSHDCAWKTAPAPMAGECPAPNVAYCDQ